VSLHPTQTVTTSPRFLQSPHHVHIDITEVKQIASLLI
jgi:hypothetical protein